MTKMFDVIPIKIFFKAKIILEFNGLNQRFSTSLDYYVDILKFLLFNIKVNVVLAYTIVQFILVFY